MDAMSDDKQVLSIKVLGIFIRPGWGIYLLTRRYVVDRPPNDTKMNSAYFCDKFPYSTRTSGLCLRESAASKRSVVHRDNCSVHTSQASIDWLEEDSIRRIPHLSDSLDLVLSDCYLFPTVKEKVERVQLADEE
jgi:hypothetical protein